MAADDPPDRRLFRPCRRRRDWRDGSPRAAPIQRGVFLVHGEEPAIAGLADASRSGSFRRPNSSSRCSTTSTSFRRRRARADRRRRADAGSRLRRWLRSTGTTTCRSSCSISTTGSRRPPTIAPAASSSGGCGGLSSHSVFGKRPRARSGTATELVKSRQGKS